MTFVTLKELSRVAKINERSLYFIAKMTSEKTRDILYNSNRNNCKSLFGLIDVMDILETIKRNKRIKKVNNDFIDNVLIKLFS